MDPLPSLPPEEAIRFFRSKGLEIGFDWRDIWEAEHARVFTVAKAMERSILETIRASVDRAISDGITFAAFSEELRPRLEAEGWWGRRDVVDPATGKARAVQLGSPRRLKTIFEMNVRQAYAAGRWERIQESKALLPLLVYQTAGDAQVRPEHRAWDGVCLPVDDPWWSTHYPPCDWGCRCTVLQISSRQAEARGLEPGREPPRFPPRTYTNPRTGEVQVIETGIGPGFNYNTGEAYLRSGAASLLPGGSEVDDATASAEDAARRFLSAFDAEAEDRVWLDREGYPQIIGPSLFLDAAGKRMKLSSAELADLDPATLLEPDRISWIWVRRGAAPAMLLRRYRRRGQVIDMASGGTSPVWRFQTVD